MLYVTTAFCVDRRWDPSFSLERQPVFAVAITHLGCTTRCCCLHLCSLSVSSPITCVISLAAESRPRRLYILLIDCSTRRNNNWGDLLRWCQRDRCACRKILCRADDARKRHPPLLHHREEYRNLANGIPNDCRSASEQTSITIRFTIPCVQSWGRWLSETVSEGDTKGTIDCLYSEIDQDSGCFNQDSVVFTIATSDRNRAAPYSAVGQAAKEAAPIRRSSKNDDTRAGRNK